MYVNISRSDKVKLAWCEEPLQGLLVHIPPRTPWWRAPNGRCVIIPAERSLHTRLMLAQWEMCDNPCREPITYPSQCSPNGRCVIIPAERPLHTPANARPNGRYVIIPAERPLHTPANALPMGDV